MIKHYLLPISLVIKLAFIYHDDSHIKSAPYLSNTIEPTYRIVFQVYPIVSHVRITVAMSSANNDGTIKPIFIVPIKP